jgi:hypothetical protein
MALRQPEPLRMFIYDEHIAVTIQAHKENWE